MKKTKKLQINPEKIMKNDELLTLKGGYDSECCECRIVGSAVRCIQSTPHSCNSDCYIQWGDCMAVYYLIR